MVGRYFSYNHLIKGKFIKEVRDFGKFVNHRMQVLVCTVDGIGEK